MTPDPHPPIRAARADRKSTPRRLTRYAASIRAHRERHAIRRALAVVALQYTRGQATR